MSIRGIDISKWNGNIDWERVKKSGLVDFAIIREGYGRKDPKQIDKKFKDNISGAESVNIPVGVYHYSYADSQLDAINEAQFCLENIRGYKLGYPVVIDIEDKELLKLNTRQRTDIVKAFCDEIEEAGYYAMFYCNLNWLNNYLYKNELLPRYDLWLAQWGVSTPAENCGIWQYSDTGNIYGISGNVDLNFAYKSYPDIMAEKGINNYSKPTSEVTYIVQKGDTLTAISKKYNVSIKHIADKNNIKDVNKIYVGQVLKI